MDNPLALAPTNRLPPDPAAMRTACWQKNQWARRIDLDRWYLVAEVNGQPAIENREGALVRDVWRALSGWYPDFEGWAEQKLAKEFGLLRHLARLGMPQEVFDQVRWASA